MIADTIRGVQKQSGIRGDYFTDKLGSATALLLALASLGIAIWRYGQGEKASDLILAGMYVLEAAGAIAIFPSKKGAMTAAFWILTIRVVLGIGYLGTFHDDKLARDTLGFPLVEAIYCWTRVRALKKNP